VENAYSPAKMFSEGDLSTLKDAKESKRGNGE
jgi:hypothetical protein